ncbi:RtcB family protein [Halosimplex aquaticum]|uniref:tRNA-splicing ligase RtcB n=1 Tax=Halosimplex aquaticum TaxID=3026162 RepID=A0ABD5XZS4_9EURY|nr:RtcB family protein [Halosimplex aquaticum]
MIRKGATAAREDQRLIIPFNMVDGSVICRGLGNDSWHRTASHGAGRQMGRTEAKETRKDENIYVNTTNVYTEHVPIDEVPIAYKNPSSILENIRPTVDIEERLDTIHNLKSKWRIQMKNG